MEDSVSVAKPSVAEDSVGEEDIEEESVGVGGKYWRSVLKIFECGESSIVEDILCWGKLIPSTTLSDLYRGEAGLLHRLTLKCSYRLANGGKCSRTWV